MAWPPSIEPLFLMQSPYFPVPIHGPIGLPPSIVREQKLAKQRHDEETAMKQREQEQERLRRMCKKKKRRTRRKHRNLDVLKEKKKK